jgi:LSD1 subclass zinc finger protein
MKLIRLKCSNCGANLEIKEDAKKIKCQYCNVTTIIDDEVIKIEHKIINDDIDRKLTNASTYLYKLEKYEEAKKTYLELSKLIPDNAAVWKGIILSETEHFSKIYSLENDEVPVDIEFIADAFKSYKALESDEKLLKKFQEDYDNYVKKYAEDVANQHLNDNQVLEDDENKDEIVTHENTDVTADPIGAIIFAFMFIFFIAVLICIFL